MEYYGNNDWRDYLALRHYGVKGMKWGKRKKRIDINGKGVQIRKDKYGNPIVVNTNSKYTLRGEKKYGKRPVGRKKRIDANGYGVELTGVADTFLDFKRQDRINAFFKNYKPKVKLKGKKNKRKFGAFKSYGVNR